MPRAVKVVPGESIAANFKKVGQRQTTPSCCHDGDESTDSDLHLPGTRTSGGVTF